MHMFPPSAWRQLAFRHRHCHHQQQSLPPHHQCLFQPPAKAVIKTKRLVSVLQMWTRGSCVMRTSVYRSRRTPFTHTHGVTWTFVMAI